MKTPALRSRTNEPPPYTITPDMLSRVVQIGEAVGRAELGRLWQTLILARWKPLFAHVPVESETHARQGEYYQAIRQSSDEGESTPFVKFMLDAILEALRSQPPSSWRHWDCRTALPSTTTISARSSPPDWRR